MNKKLLLCLLMWVMCMPAFAQETETLTVFDGTTEGTETSIEIKTNDYLPVYTRYWNKAGTKSQFIIPAQFLTQMKGGDITSVKFYSTSYSTPYTSASTADAYVGEVGYTTFDASEGHFDFEPKANCTVIYQGKITVERVGPTNQEWGEMTITFSTPYKYRGGNLLIGFENTTAEGWKQFKFRGQNVMWHAGLAGCQLTDTYYYKQQCDFIPWTTFTYTPGTLPAYEEFYMVGSFNSWNTNEDGGRLVFAGTEEDGVYETEGTLEAGAEFKVITPNGEGNDWIWLGGIDEYGGGYFLINNGLLNTPLQLVDGSNFRMENGGKFTFRLNVNDMTLTVIPDNTGVSGDVNGDGEVTSFDITLLYNYILSGDMTDIVNGDQDGDGAITTHDVTFVYEILLAGK
ncbi:MAG: hypothetical protein IJR20_08045 [Muribaculaceae bacterium]|nr:hypothetical protein [Muribaculaceae bacterium]